MSELEDSSLKILKILKAAGEQYVSGEELSSLLGISRTAVWKRMDSLKKEGFDIEASTKIGYRLGNLEDPYGKLAIQSGINGSVMGRKLKFYQEVDSTNTVLKKMAADNAPEGTIVLADTQSAGRGRRGRTWMSAPKMGIWMSVLLRPTLHPSQVQTLTLAASAAVVKALEQQGIKGLGIKWPNDILINGEKVCGILTELSAEAERVEWVILGIGLNVNHSESDFPPELKSIATSIRLNHDSPNELNRSRIAAGIINELEDVYNSFIANGPSWVVEEWKKWNITLGKRVYLINETNSRKADVIDIAPDGKLIVRYDDGTTGEVISGEISLRGVY